MNRKTMGEMILAGVLALICAAQAWTGQQPVQPGTKADAKKPLDEQFLMKAFIDGHKEIVLGRLAVKQARNEKVRDFGEHMVRDHTKANEKIAQLLKQRKTGFLAGTEKELDQEKAHLEKLQGEEFDRVYMKMMVKDLQDAVALFQHQAEHGQEKDIVQFARETLPTLQEHLQMAQRIATEVGAGKGDRRKEER